jgi:hypothetical protein
MITNKSTRSSIIVRLLDHAEKNWPQLAKVGARYHGSFAYITGVLRNGEQIPLFRLRYGGSAQSFGFAIYSAARARYEDAVLLTGSPAGKIHQLVGSVGGRLREDEIQRRRPSANRYDLPDQPESKVRYLPRPEQRSRRHWLSGRLQILQQPRPRVPEKRPTSAAFATEVARNQLRSYCPSRTLHRSPGDRSICQ